MCTCIKNLEAKLVGTEHKKKKIIKADFISQALIFDDKFTGIKSYSEVELTVEGGKKPLKQNVIHSFCPFCGKKYSKK